MKWKKGSVIIFVDPVTYTVAKVVFKGETKYHWRLAFPKSEGVEIQARHKAKTMLLKYEQDQYEALFNLSVSIKTAKKSFEKHLLSGKVVTGNVM